MFFSRSMQLVVLSSSRDLVIDIKAKIAEEAKKDSRSGYRRAKATLASCRVPGPFLERVCHSRDLQAYPPSVIPSSSSECPLAGTDNDLSPKTETIKPIGMSDLAFAVFFSK